MVPALTCHKAKLLHGAGEMKEYDQLGMGNYVLAGHRMKKKGLLFYDIVRLNNGDKVYVTDKKKIYEYQVAQTDH
ncbi:sortase domain-containing protein [Siminovitchia fordii]|nr:sortase [Siminovitchia fordii]